MNKSIPTLTHATERDIDLIIVEEAIANRKFVEWVAEKIGLPVDFVNWKVLHSKRRTRSRREIDICMEVFDGEDRPLWVLLVENKLDADEQPDQAESYRKELLAPQYDGYAHAKMALFCPKEYWDKKSEFAAKFDNVVIYEDLAEFFKNSANSSSETGRRSNFRKDCVQQAIHKYRRGYHKIPNPIIQDFNQSYVSLMHKIARDLIPGKTMLEPAKPNDSVSMILDNRTLNQLPKSIRPRRMAIELGKGDSRRANYAAVTFGGWGNGKDDIRKSLDHMTDEDLTRFLNLKLSAKPPTKTRPNPGLVLSTPTCPVDNQGDFSAQRDTIVDGILKAKLLREWLLKHQDLLQRWRDIVEGKDK